MAKRLKVRRVAGSDIQKAAPVEVTVKDQLNLSKRMLAKVTDEQLGKSSQSAIWALEHAARYQDSITNPTELKDWLDVYCKHVWAYASVYAVANTVAPIPRKLVQREGQKEEKESFSHPVLRLLQRPNDQWTDYGMFESLVVFLECTGMAYWEVVYGSREVSVQQNSKAAVVVKATQTPVELWPIRPDQLTPIPRKDGRGIEKYVFQAVKYGKKRDLQPQNVIAFQYFNPTSDGLTGLGSLQPAIADIRLDSQMSKWNLDFFKDGLTPEGLLRTEKSLSPGEMKLIGKQVREYLSGKGRTLLVLGRGLSWQAMSQNMKDIDFSKGRADNRQAVLASVGVPPVKVGLLEHAKYDNYALQQAAFHQDTILPRLATIASTLTCKLLPLFGDLDESWSIGFDTSGLILQDLDRITDRSLKQIRNGISTINEVRERLGMKRWEDPAGDEHWMEANVTIIPVGGKPALPELPKNPPKPLEKPVEVVE